LKQDANEKPELKKEKAELQKLRDQELTDNSLYMFNSDGKPIKMTDPNVMSTNAHVRKEQFSVLKEHINFSDQIGKMKVIHYRPEEMPLVERSESAQKLLDKLNNDHLIKKKETKA
jgi:hypothetical protein